MAVDNYPVSDGPVGSVDTVRLQRVANVMHQFLPFPQFSIVYDADGQRLRQARPVPSCGELPGLEDDHRLGRQAKAVSERGGARPVYCGSAAATK